VDDGVFLDGGGGGGSHGSSRRGVPAVVDTGAVTDDEEPLDLGRPLRGVEQLAALVAHVHRAHPKNETDWLEWKTGLDLTSAAGRFEVARQILGFANRDPDVARRHAGGLAYLILGIEPGNPCGQSLIDNADLTASIGRVTSSAKVQSGARYG
jgi:hypothetical protein